MAFVGEPALWLCSAAVDMQPGSEGARGLEGRGELLVYWDVLPFQLPGTLLGPPHTGNRGS